MSIEKKFNNQYVYNPISRTIDFSSIVGFDFQRLVKVTNSNNSTTLFLRGGGGNGYGGSWSNNILTLERSDSLGSDSDRLLFTLDNELTVQSPSLSTPVVNTDLVTGLLTTDPNINYLDVRGYNTATLTLGVTGTVTTGQITIEGATVNQNFITVAARLAGGTPNPAVTTSAVSLVGTNISPIYVIDISKYNMLRIRVSTGFVGAGSTVRSGIELSTAIGEPVSLQVYQGTGSNLVTTSTISGTPTTNTNIASILLPTSTTDVASSTISATTATAYLTPSSAGIYESRVRITAITGQWQIDLFESLDTGVTERRLWSSPLISNTGDINIPEQNLSGNRLKYNFKLISGPGSMTRSVVRTTKFYPVVVKSVNNIHDLVLDLNTSGQSSSVLQVYGTKSSVELTVGVRTHDAGTNPTIALEGSISGDPDSWDELDILEIRDAVTYKTPIIEIMSYTKFRAVVKVSGSGTVVSYINISVS